MHARHGRAYPEVQIDAFAFQLAFDLGKTLGEIEAMPYLEYLHWNSWYAARAQRQEVTG